MFEAIGQDQDQDQDRTRVRLNDKAQVRASAPELSTTLSPEMSGLGGANLTIRRGLVTLRVVIFL